jgi:hypothetical protein
VDQYSGNQRRQRKEDDLRALPNDVHAMLLFEDVYHDAPPVVLPGDSFAGV